MHEAFDSAIAVLASQGMAFTLHQHEASRTVADAVSGLPFPLARFLKTIAFRIKSGGYVLAALRGQDRVDYRRLAAACGTRRAEVISLSAKEIADAFGVEAGSLGPTMSAGSARVFFDTRVPVEGTIFCGIGRADRTLEARLPDLVRVTGGLIVPLASEASQR